MQTLRPTRVLVAVDFGDASAAAVTLGGVLARSLGASLTVLHAETIEMPPYFTEAQVSALEAERRAARETAERYVQTFARTHTAVPATAVVVEGRAVDVILRAVRAGDLLVLGTHGLRGARRWWLGSVAESVVRGAHVPVLVTRGLTAEALTRLQAGAVTVLASHPDARPVQTWTRILHESLGATISTTPELAVCGPDTLLAADLVVVPRGVTTDLDAAAAQVLKSCQHPVLFVPDEQDDAVRVS